MNSPVLDVSRKWNRTARGLLCLISFTERRVFRAHPYSNVYQSFILFCGWIIFHCLYGPRLVYPLICDWHLCVSGFFPLWIMLLWTSFCWNSCFQLSWVSWNCWVMWFGWVLCLSFWEAAKPLTTVAAPFCIPTGNGPGFQFLHVFTNTYFSFFF